MRVFKNSPPSLRSIWLASAAHGDKPFLVYEDERYSFAETHRIVAALADRLGTYGVQQGDRVAIAMRNYPEWAFAFWATVSIGAVAVPLNAWWTGPELAYGLSDSGSVVLFADGSAPSASRPSSATPRCATSCWPAPSDTCRTRRRSPTTVGELDVIALPDVTIAPDDDATIMYTSGTTGKPKGAVATHRNFTAYLMNVLYRQTTAAAAANPPAADAPPAPPPFRLRPSSPSRSSTSAACSRHSSCSPPSAARSC